LGVSAFNFLHGYYWRILRSVPITVSVTLIASLLVALTINHPLAAVLERVRLTKNFSVSILLLY